MAAFGIHELRKQTATEYPDAHFHEMFGRTKDRVVDAVKGANIGERASKLRLPEVRKPEAGEGATSEAPTATTPGNEEDARLARLERFWRTCTRRASSPTRSSPPRSRGSWATTPQPPDLQARRRNRTGNLLITNQVLSQVELGGHGGDNKSEMEVNFQISGAR